MVKLKEFLFINQICINQIPDWLKQIQIVQETREKEAYYNLELKI